MYNDYTYVSSLWHMHYTFIEYYSLKCEVCTVYYNNSISSSVSSSKVVLIIITRCPAIAERPHCRVR